MRRYSLFRTYQSSLWMWGVPVLFVIVGPLFPIAVWNSWTHGRIVGIVFGTIWWLYALGFLLWALRIPRRIELREDGIVVFRGPLRTLEVHASEISSIRPGRYQLGFLVLKHSRGKLQLLNQFDGFHEFLTRIERINPGIEFRGC